MMVPIGTDRGRDRPDTPTNGIWNAFQTYESFLDVGSPDDPNGTVVRLAGDDDERPPEKDIRRSQDTPDLAIG